MGTKNLRNAALVLGLFAWAGTPAHADTITFKNGHEVHGRLVEETPDYIIFQVGTGKLKFSKKEIATFTEDADYGQRYFTPPRRAAEGEEAVSVPGAPLRTWREHKDASAEERRDLRAVHIRILEELAKLGPAPDERDRKLSLTGPERAALDAQVQSLSRGRTDGYGFKAIPTLADLLQIGDTATKTGAALALADAVTRGDVADVKYLLGKNKVSTRLCALLEISGDDSAPAARNAANRALEVISGTSVGWLDSKEAFPSASQRDASKKWREWADKDQAAWEAAEKATAEKRKTLDDSWRALEDSKTWRTALAAAIDAYGTTPTTGAGATPTPPADGTAPTNPDIAKQATPEEQKQLAETKKRLKDTLTKLVGPSLEERKKKYELTSDERQSLQIVIHNLGQSGRRGSGNLIRNNAAAELLTYGLRAAGLLSELCGGGDNLYARWSAATALGNLAKTGDAADARTLMFAYDAPAKVAALLDENTDDKRSPYIRSDANKALEAISGTSVGWVDGTTQALSEAEKDCRDRWNAWVSTATAEFKRVEKAREEHRKALGDLEKKLDSPRNWREALAAASKAIEQAEKDLKR